MAKKKTSGTQTKQVKFITAPTSFNDMAKAFGTARMAKLSGYGGKHGTSTGTAREAEKLYLGVIGYAEKYGTGDQITKARTLNPAKLRWMYMHKIFKTEEVFAYTAKGNVATPHIIHYEDEQELRGGLELLFYRYDKLNAEANRQQRERRKARK